MSKCWLVSIQYWGGCKENLIRALSFFFPLWAISWGSSTQSCHASATLKITPLHTLRAPLPLPKLLSTGSSPAAQTTIPSVQRIGPVQSRLSFAASFKAHVWGAATATLRLSRPTGGSSPRHLIISEQQQQQHLHLNRLTTTPQRLLCLTHHPLDPLAREILQLFRAHGSTNPYNPGRPDLRNLDLPLGIIEWNIVNHPAQFPRTNAIA
jgi:hypothetical protein